MTAGREAQSQEGRHSLKMLTASSEQKEDPSPSQPLRRAPLSSSLPIPTTNTSPTGQVSAWPRCQSQAVRQSPEQRRAQLQVAEHKATTVPQRRRPLSRSNAPPAPQPPPALTVGAVTAKPDDNEDFHGSPLSAQPSLPPLSSSAQLLRHGIGPQHSSQRRRRGWAGGGGLLHAPNVLARGVPPYSVPALRMGTQKGSTAGSCLVMHPQTKGCSPLPTPAPRMPYPPW